MQIKVTAHNPWIFLGATLLIAVVIAILSLPGRLTGIPIGPRLSPTMLIAAGAASLPWLIATAAFRIFRQPIRPAEGPATPDLSEESPAVANLLTNGFEVTRDAIPATLLDLAARGAISIEETGQENYQVRLGKRQADLAPYEARVMELLRRRASDGVVPAGALTTGPEKQAKAWWRTFRAAVIDDAQRRGLSRNLWDARVMSALAVLALPAAPLYWLAVHSWLGAMWYVFLCAGILGAVQSGRRQRDTNLGLQAGGRWLGVRRYLREGAFEDLPPTSVAVWERYLAYAAAFGVARAAVRPFPMGADDDRQAWSHMGGRWRLVRIRYPLFWPHGWGRSPELAVFLGLFGTALSAAIVFGLGKLHGLLGLGSLDPRVTLDGQTITGIPANVAAILRLVIPGLSVIVGLLGLRAFLQVAYAVSDLGQTREVTGLVLRVRSYGGGKDSPPRRYVAIDGGESEEVDAYRLTPKVWATTPPLDEYQPATAIVTPRLGHVRTIRQPTG